MQKPLTLLTSFACFCAFLILTPCSPGQAAGAAAKLQTLSQELKLTPEQKLKLLPILQAEAPKLEAIKNDSSLTGMQKMKQIHAIHSENAAPLQKILTATQYQQLQTIREADIRKAIAAKRAAH